MPAGDSIVLDIVTVASYLAVLWIPGGLAAAAVGLRGWLLAASAPMVSYLLAGLAGPWLSIAGLPFTPTSFALCTVLVIAIFGLLRWITVRRGHVNTTHPGMNTRQWPVRGHLAVAGCVLIAAVAGFAMVLAGMGRLNAIPQDYDAVFHANGIRYISETGDGGVYGMGNINWYGQRPGLFYPNAYHLIASIVYRLTGAPIPTVLNANTVLLPGMLALSLVAAIRYWRGRPMLAGYSALAAASASAGLYESIARGPLLPYLVSVALTPLVAPLLARYLDRPVADRAAMLLAAGVGLLAIHSSAPFNAVLFAVPMLVQRWWRHTAKLRADLRALLVPAVIGIVVAVPMLLGALHANGSEPVFPWPTTFTAGQAVGALLTFQHVEGFPQWWLAIALWIGLFTWRRLAGLGWLLGVAGLTGALFVLVASYGQPWVVKLASPWWDDRYRLVALAMLPLCVLAGHGMVELGCLLTRLGSRYAPKLSGMAMGAASAVVVLVIFGLGSNGMYFAANRSIVAAGYDGTPNDPNDPHNGVVSPNDVIAMRKLATLVGTGQRVLNDRGDGSAWMYALTGAQPVAGHYDGWQVSPDAMLLEDHFNEYGTNPQVRAAIRRLNVHYVLLDSNFLRPDWSRAFGLRGLDSAPFVREIYRNQDAVIYQLVPDPAMA